MLTFSVVACTHNRAHYLPDLIASLRAQDYPAQDFEIIIVDNASIDGTRAIVEQLQNDHEPPLRYVHEPITGANRARNAGAKAANGEIVAYIDDDAIAEPDWLERLARSFERTPDEVVCLGGGVQLLWENGNRPSWLANELDGYYSSTSQIGETPRYLNGSECPILANMAVRRESLLALDGFDPSLDRVGKNLLSNAEAEFCAKVRDAGLRVYFEPSARVWHKVPAGRATKRWLLRRTFWQGMSDAVLVWHREMPSRTILLKRVTLNVGKLFQQSGHAVRYWLGRQEPEALGQLCFAAAYLGRIRKDLQYAVARRHEESVPYG
jgi:glycosyltransferase involved in cell wall biosynthesis